MSITTIPGLAFAAPGTHFLIHEVPKLINQFVDIPKCQEQLLDLLSVHLKNDNVQGFDTKCDEVLLSP